MTDIAKEYGTALFMLAVEKNEKKSYGDSLESIRRIFLENPDYTELLSSPSIPLKERLSVIDEAFAATAPEHVLSYMKLLCERGRISHFTESVEAYLALLDASEHVSAAKVTSAIALTEAEKEKLVKQLEAVNNCRIEAEYFTDPSLLGGLIIEVDGKIMDGSLRHRLHEVKEVMNT